MDVYEIESELILLDLFGFKVGNSTVNNKINILDEDCKVIGFIEKIILHNNNGKPIFGIYTEIITEDILYKDTREIITSNNRNVNDKSYSYDIAKRNKDGSLNYVYLNLGVNSEISFWYNNYPARFKIKKGELTLNFRGKTKNFNYEETLSINAFSKTSKIRNKSYEYTLKTCDKENDLSEGKNTVFSVTGNELYHYFSCSEGEKFDPCFRLNIRKTIYGRLVENYYYNIQNSNIKDLILIHNDGLEAFSHFRYLANNLLPFKKEIISFIFDEKDLIDEFSMFVKKKSRHYYKK